MVWLLGGTGTGTVWHMDAILAARMGPAYRHLYKMEELVGMEGVKVRPEVSSISLVPM